MRACVFVALFVVGCSSGSSSSCPLKGTGTASITSIDTPSSWFSAPATTDCTSGAAVNTAQSQREATFEGSQFELFVRLRSDDTGTGARTAGGFNLAPGTAGISAHFINDAGVAAEYDNIADAGTITITSNSDTLAGSFDSIHLEQSACSSASCAGAPSSPTISGTFSAKY
jgi:hypothetical protein